MYLGRSRAGPDARGRNPKVAPKVAKSPFEAANRWIQFSVRGLNPAAKFCVIGLDKIRTLERVGLTCTLAGLGPVIVV